ncbi:SAM-dependent methyltransferase [Paenibacillus sp. CAA11]|uniref:class I SAM-dependent methyltransferase n=1 Tax=Paenibacillus sp. CAA11 TaxID=1532905 RepID=UPI000D36AC4C|nr:class I SAM-dependent methyltransferase [Paenibacillus sp. CAA11]AWB46454.1 SAM-dependent methyltransferase [Paenibacillus sp. CAA11]
MAGLIYQVISGVLAAVILFGALSIVLISWKNGITPMPSSAYARRVVTRELKQIGTRGNLVEAGSGWGHLALEIGAHCSGWSIVGIENSQIPLGVSQLAARLRRLRNVRFLRGDLYTFPYEDVDVVVCYLFPGAMTRLSKLLRTRLSPGAKVISVCFALPGWTPERIITCRDTYQTKIYVYAR